MKYAIIGTYLPRECGIATFSFDLYQSMKNEAEGFVVALNDPNQNYDYPSEVKCIINEECFKDYSDAADYINDHADICILQHEFNIFGGDNGIYILSLLHKLKVPLITTLHTILKKPTSGQKYVTVEICKLSRKLIVLSQVAADILSSIYKVPKDNISMIRHGVPDINLDTEESRDKLDLSGKKVMLTFGLINRNKGIETVLRALPGVVERYPETRYIVLGKSHPAVVRLFGEDYRNYLEKIVTELNLQDYVRFVNRFVSSEELYEYLAAADILITPYLNEAQVSSGPLSFALGADTALVSTPFWHATELLANGRGKLFNFRDYNKLSEILIDLLGNPDDLKNIKKKSLSFGKRIIWPVIGQDYLSLIHSELEESKKAIVVGKPARSPRFPKISFRHIFNLTDPTGIISDAKYGFPNLKNGYHLENNARALFATCMYYKKNRNKDLKILIKIYLSFLQYMQKDDGRFRNHLNYDKSYDDENGTDDSLGTALWALGYLVNNPPDMNSQELAKDIFKKAYRNSENISKLSGIAYSVMGITNYLQAYKIDQVVEEFLYQLVIKIKDQYKKNKSPEWKWFETKISGDNAVLPLSLMLSAQITQDKEAVDIAFESMKFLTDNVIIEGQLSLIGNKTWYCKGEERSYFDQLPMDAMNLILLYQKAFELTNDRNYYKLSRICFNWFLGKNDLYIYLYDPETRGCFDGLTRNGVNLNQGAESTLSFVISQLAMQEIIKDIQKEESAKDPLNPVKQTTLNF